jgi:hypothetical protein
MQITGYDLEISITIPNLAHEIVCCTVLKL